ncbi:MAG: hypothetical protein AB1401_02810 [Thermodesulfobacteriota bacterium]
MMNERRRTRYIKPASSVRLLLTATEFKIEGMNDRIIMKQDSCSGFFLKSLLPRK